MSHPQCHARYDFPGIDWASDAPGREAAGSFLGSFGRCPYTCQDRCRDAAAADSAATTLVVFALISTAIAMQGDQLLAKLLRSASTVPPLARSVFTTVMDADFAGARDTVRTSLAEASVPERSALIEWWANTAALPPGQIRAFVQARRRS